MSVFRQILLFFVGTLIIFLALFTWNDRTGKLDQLGADVGLEITGHVLRLMNTVSFSYGDFWKQREELERLKAENDKLKKKLRETERRIIDFGEEKAELIRLRELVKLDFANPWPSRASQVLSWRVGPNSALHTLILASGYLNGAAPGTPVVSREGLAGRILKAGPMTSLLLLLTDTGSRVAVITSEGRVQGILSGEGPGLPLELRFVRQNSPVHVGEILVTSGADSYYPKGIPVARVTSITTGASSRSGASVLEIQAEPLVRMEKMEEVLLLQRPANSTLPEKEVVYTPRKSDLETSAERELGAMERP